MKLILVLIFSSAAFGSTLPELLRSKDVFSGAIEKRSRYLSAREACGNETLPWKIICLEGYYFQETLFEIRNSPTLTQAWALPLASDPIRSLAIGMAYGYLNRAIPDAYLFLGKQTHYILDGWAFLQHSLRPGSRPDLCSRFLSPDPLRQFCLFGQGRANLFLGNEGEFGRSSNLGRSYAGAVHAVSGMEIPAGITQVLNAQFSMNDSTKIGDCLRRKHHLDCIIE